MKTNKQFSVGTTVKRERMLKRRAKAEGRTLSNYVNRLIDQALDAEDRKAAA